MTWYVLIIAIEFATTGWQSPARSPAFSKIEDCKATMVEVKKRYVSDPDVKEIVVGCNPLWFPEEQYRATK